MKAISMALLLTLLITSITIPTAVSSTQDKTSIVLGLLKEIGSALLHKIEDTLGALNSSNTLVLTNAKYVVIKGYDLYPITVPMIARGLYPLYNMLYVHSMINDNLWILAYRNDTHKALYLEVSRDAIAHAIGMVKNGGSIEEAVKYVIRKGIAKISVFNLDIDEIVEEGKKDPDRVWKELVKETDRLRAFSILTIVAVWSKGAPQELLLSAELHNHVCPGLISGVLMIDFLMKRGYVSPKSKIYVVAVPVWCKDDAFVQLLDATPGKRRISVKLLTKKEEEELKKILGSDAAGIVIVVEPNGEGKAYVMTFNWDKACSLANIEKKMFRGKYWWWSRLVLDLTLLKYFSRPEELVGIAKAVKFKGYVGRYPKLFYNASLIGRDPYSVLGVITKGLSPTFSSTAGSSTAPRKSVNISLVAIAVAVLAIIVGTLIYLARRR